MMSNDPIDTPGISSVLYDEWIKGVGRASSRGAPTAKFDAPDGGGLVITLDNGAVLAFWTSEWGGVEYYAPAGKQPQEGE